VSRARCNGARPGAGGFTLLELLLAVVILGLLLASVYGAVARTAFSKNVAEDRAELYSSGRKAVLQMASDIEGAIPPLLGDRIYFRGQAAEAEFVMMNRGGYLSNGVRSGRVLVVYSLDPIAVQHGSFALKREEYLFTALLADTDGTALPTPADGEDNAPTDQATYLLDCPNIPDDLDLPGACMRVTGLRFRYYDDVVRDWRDEWDSTQDAEFERIPAAVQISMLLADKDGKERDFSTIVDLPLARGQPTPEATGAPAPGPPTGQQTPPK
jgi:prepilin-type N-terminal cleavage/methylation domain-containing protein